MLWSEKLYLGAGAEKHYRRIKWKIMHNIAQTDIFLLILPLKYEQHLQLVHSTMFLQKNWPKNDICVVGIVRGRQEGLDLIQQITSEMYEQTGVIDYYGFFHLESPGIHRGKE